MLTEFNDPDPFDHGTTTIDYAGLEDINAYPILNLVNFGWPHIRKEDSDMISVEALTTGVEINSKNFRLTSESGNKYILKKTTPKDAIWQIYVLCIYSNVEDGRSFTSKTLCSIIEVFRRCFYSF